MSLVIAFADSYTTWGVCFFISSHKGRPMVRENQSTDISPVVTKVTVAVQRVGYLDIFPFGLFYKALSPGSETVLGDTLPHLFCEPVVFEE